jgi:hypothetical protein
VSRGRGFTAALNVLPDQVIVVEDCADVVGPLWKESDQLDERLPSPDTEEEVVNVDL